MAKISVIIPVYCVEKYIERCARSLFEQTLDDIEFLFVDDCSPDNSIEVLKKTLQYYPAREKQTKIIKMSSNSGQAAVRKYGIELASGDYIIHCDSDDWTEITMYERMYQAAVVNNADIVICNYFISSDASDHKINFEMPSDKNKQMFTNVSTWQKLVSRDIYSKIDFFPTCSMWEDRLITIQLLYRANIVTYIEEPLYHYYINDNSICRKFSYQSTLKRFKESSINLQMIEKFVNENNIASVDKYIFDLKYQVLVLLAPITIKKEYYKLWKGTYPEVHKTLLKSNIQSIKKLKYLLTYIRVFPFIKYLSNYFSLR